MKFQKTNLVNQLTWLLIPLFLGITLVRLLYFDAGNAGSYNKIDDWFRYADNAKDILNNGLLISKQQDAYYGPGSFLYNYFVAIHYQIFGISNFWIYLTQSILLAFSVKTIHFLFAKNWEQKWQLILLFALTTIAFTEIYKNYTCRLLSENLGLFLITLFLYVLQRFLESKQNIYFFLTFVVLGIGFLTRPNILPFVVIFPIIIWLYREVNQRNSWIFICGILVMTGLLAVIALRNELVTGVAVWMPTEGVSDALSQTIHSEKGYFLKKIAFSLGYLPALNVEYQIRPHWLILWFGYFLFLFNLRKKRLIEIPFEMILNTLLVVFFGTCIVFAILPSYGFRIFLPIFLPLTAITIKAIHDFKTQQND